MTPETISVLKPRSPLKLGPQVRPASVTDVAEIAQLLERRAPVTIPVPAEQVADDLERYRVIRGRNSVLATAALQPVGGDRLELRSVAVADDCAGRGLGTHMVTALQREAARQSKRLVCVTISPEFFERMGFEKAPLGVVPPKPEREECPIEGTRVAMAWSPDDNEHERTEDELPRVLRSA